MIKEENVVENAGCGSKTIAYMLVVDYLMNLYIYKACVTGVNKALPQILPYCINRIEVLAAMLYFYNDKISPKFLEGFNTFFLSHDTKVTPTLFFGMLENSKLAVPEEKEADKDVSSKIKEEDICNRPSKE